MRSHIARFINWLLSNTEPYSIQSTLLPEDINTIDTSNDLTDDFIVQPDDSQNNEDDVVNEVTSEHLNSLLTNKNQIQSENGRFSISIVGRMLKNSFALHLLLQLCQTFCCLLTERMGDIKQPIYIISDPPNGMDRCHEQYAHTDGFMDSWDGINSPDWNKKELNIKISCIFAFQTSYLYYWEQSAHINRDNVQYYIQSNKKFTKRCLKIRRGELCLFLGSLVHAGYDYRKKNGRIHFYFEMCDDILNIIHGATTEASYFFNVKSITLYKLFAGAK